MRVVFAALCLCLLSFAVGVLGDLSLAQPPSPSATVQIPPNAVRARPLPPLPRTDSAEASPRLERTRPPLQKPRANRGKAGGKINLDLAPKVAAAK